MTDLGAVENWQEATRVGQELRKVLPDAQVLPYPQLCEIEPYNFIKSSDLLQMLSLIERLRVGDDCGECPTQRHLRIA